MTYDFSRFTPGSFEALVQSLCQQVLGAGTIVFGPGADGGRDAMFEGKVPYPSTEDAWNGYIVIQAKCREQLRGDASDADWLVDQINREYKKFADSNKLLRKPQYYIIATNVQLSGIPETAPPDSGGKVKRGGLAKVNAALAAWNEELGTVKCDVWHATTIARFLDNYDSIRNRYSAWHTPSDLITAIVKKLTITPDFASILYRAMATDLQGNLHTKLQDASHTGTNKIKLSSIFIDVPVDPLQPPPNSDLPVRQDKEPLPGVTAYLARYASQAFQPRQISLSKPTDHKYQDRRQPNRVVLLGGPGQGKSTIAQFLIQFFQAQLLSATGQAQLAPETWLLCQEVLQRAKEAGLPEHLPFRYPVRVSLPVFADRITEMQKKNVRLSLLRFIVNELGKAAETEINIDSMRDWLASYPWLLVLDGLDEVPPSGARDPVIQEIRAFWNEVFTAKADVMAVVTTRPQGYNNDLEPELWQHWKLAPLNRDEALRYAKSLAHATIPDIGERETALTRLRQRSRAKAAEQLLSSPLQVAIMLSLVNATGDVATNRWDLFHGYFLALRDRELQKPETFSSILRTHWPDIETLHHRVGFLLHSQAEIAGSADPQLSIKTFSSIVRDYFNEQGFNEDQLAQLILKIEDLIKNRLVLLVVQTEGNIKFDVRSLQEFMAAAFVTSGPDTAVQDRLRSIANLAHWQHVFLICASRCFADTSKVHFQDTIASICNDLDESADEVADRLTRCGARLALDLLSDGLASTSPNRKRQLFARAIHILELGSTNFDNRLPELLDDDVRGVLSSFILDYLPSPSTRSGAAAWKLLWARAAANDSWATGLVLSSWPEDAESRMAVIKLCPPSVTNRSLIDKINTSILVSGLGVVAEHLQWSWPLMPEQAQKFAQNFPLLRFRTYMVDSSAMIQVELPRTFGQTATISIAPITSDIWTPYATIEDLAQWEIPKYVARFAANPTGTSLSAALTAVSQSDESALNAARNYPFLFPWPIGSLIWAAVDRDHLKAFAERARAGQFGSSNDWIAAETRLRSWTASLEELKALGSATPWGIDIARRGVPFTGKLSFRAPAERPPVMDGWIDFLSELPFGETFNVLSFYFLIACELHETPKISSKRVMKLLAKYESSPGLGWGESKLLNLCFVTEFEGESSDEVLDCLDRLGRKYSFAIDDFYWGVSFTIPQIVASDADRRGLIPFAALLIAGILPTHRRMFPNAHDALLDHIPGPWFKMRKDDPPHIAVAASVLRGLSKPWKGRDVINFAEALLAFGAEKRTRSFLRSNFLEQFFETSKMANQSRIDVLSRISTAIPTEAEALSRLLRGALDARRSTLCMPGEWSRLSFPKGLMKYV